MGKVWHRRKYDYSIRCMRTQLTRSRLGKFKCNICGTANDSHAGLEDREEPNCRSCNSNMRLRSVILAISRAIFGTELSLPEFPQLKSLRGLGISDSEIYSRYLENRFTYLNTFYHQPPRFDLSAPDESEFGKYDFVICSEVLEHVSSPVDRAFASLSQLLKPSGVLIVTAPFCMETATLEHFPSLVASSLARIGQKIVLVGRSDDGTYQVFENLVFHGGPGSTLECRLFSEMDLRHQLSECGLHDVHFVVDSCEKFGVHFITPCSVPIIASRQPFSVTVSTVRELVEQVSLFRRPLNKSRWLKLGRVLGVGPRFPQLKP